MEGYNWSYGVIQRVNVMVALMSIKSHQIEELDKFIFVVHGEASFNHHGLPVLLDHVDKVLLVRLNQETAPIPMELQKQGIALQLSIPGTT